MSVSVAQLKQFIGGEWVESSSGETMEVVNPATGEVIAEVPSGTAEDVEKAVDAARKAWGEWQYKTPKDRMELLLALADVIDENAEELCAVRVAERRKALGVAEDETPAIGRQPPLLRRGGAQPRGQVGSRVRRGLHVDDPARAARHRRRDLPWNYPLYMAMWKIGPALAAGNVQIIKPAEQTPLTMLRFVELAQERHPARRPPGRHR